MKCQEHGKILPHYDCAESERWLDEYNPGGRVTEYRTGHHWRVTIVREGTQPPDANGKRADAQLVAVVVNGDQALAERICALLNASEPAPEIEVTRASYVHPMAAGQCSHSRIVEYNLAVGIIVHIVDGTRCYGEVMA